MKMKAKYLLEFQILDSLIDVAIIDKTVASKRMNNQDGPS
jgi:hypothetical protein